MAAGRRLRRPAAFVIGYVTGRKCPLQFRMLYAAVAGDPGLGSPRNTTSFYESRALDLSH